MRTTLDLDGTVLTQLKALQRREGKSLGRLASELLAKALAEHDVVVEPFVWSAQPMGAKVDLEDRDGVQRLLDDQR